jgi:hypothetical protein
MGAIELKPIETMTGEPRQLGVDDAVGTELDIMTTSAGAYQRINHKGAPPSV